MCSESCRRSGDFSTLGLCCAGRNAVLYLAVHAIRQKGLPLVQHMTQAQQLQVFMQADQHGLDNLNMSNS